MRNRKRGDNGNKKTAPKPMPKIEEEALAAWGRFQSEPATEVARGDDGGKKAVPKIEEEMALALGPFLSKLDAERARGALPERV
jgi:hypothetical protein